MIYYYSSLSPVRRRFSRLISSSKSEKIPAKLFSNIVSSYDQMNVILLMRGAAINGTLYTQCSGLPNAGVNNAIQNRMSKNVSGPKPFCCGEYRGDLKPLGARLWGTADISRVAM